MHKSRKRPLKPSTDGHPKLSQELADEIRRTARPPKRTLRKTLRVPVLFIRNWLYRRRMKRKKNEPVPLDEYGLPLSWHHADEYGQRLADETRDEWERFERWAKEQGQKPIRASTETVLRYLDQLPRAERSEAYNAISYKHESIYWHTGGCPHCELKIGRNLTITDEGEITYPPVNHHWQETLPKPADKRTGG